MKLNGKGNGRQFYMKGKSSPIIALLNGKRNSLKLKVI